jgi:hypothetical protein
MADFCKKNCLFLVDYKFDFNYSEESGIYNSSRKRSYEHKLIK